MTPLWESTNIATWRRKERRTEEKWKTKQGCKDLLSLSVLDRKSTIARHEASFFKPAELSEQLRSVTCVRLGTVRCRVQIWLYIEQQVWEKKTFLDLFPCFDLCSICIVCAKRSDNKSWSPRSVFHFSSLLLSFLLRVAMFVGSHSGVTLQCAWRSWIWIRVG